MRFQLRTLLTQFTIRDLLWLTAMIALIVVWRSDLSKKETAYRNAMANRTKNRSHDVRRIRIVAERHPELLAEVNALETDESRFWSEWLTISERLTSLAKKANDLYRRDAGRDLAPFFDEEPIDPFAQ